MKFKQKENLKRHKKGKKKDKKKDEEGGTSYTTNVQFIDNDELCKQYCTDLEKGLTSQKAKELIERFGPNELTPPPSLPWYVKLLQSIFGGFFNQLLWAGAILCFVAFGIDPAFEKDKTNLYLGVVLAVVVTLTGIFGYYQEAKSDDIMEGFKNLAPEDVNCWRDGKQGKLEPKFLVPGDIIEVRYGSKLPADVRIMECSADMEVDNASLTGEADPQKRQYVPSQDPDTLPQEAKNLAFFGTNMLKGTGKAMVYMTGDNTFMGSIAKMAADTGNVETPIAVEIKDFVFKVSLIAFSLGISFFIIGMVKSGGDVVPNIIFLIGIIVANVPEGLLATVTVSLTLTARRMAQKNVRVKNLESVETLGSTSVICSDKTGTLTTSIMTVQHVMFDLKEVLCDTSDPEHATNGDFYDKHGNMEQAASFKRLMRIGILCNNSNVMISEKTGKKSYTSDPTEQAIFKFTLGNLGQLLTTRGLDANTIRKKHYPQCGKSAAIPFNSANKWQVSVHGIDTDVGCLNKEEKSGDSVVAIKGAPERILGMCEYYLLNGEKRKLDESAREEIRDLNRRLAERGERVLGFADQLLDGKHYDRSIPEVIFDQDTMMVGDYKVPQGSGSDNQSLFVEYNGKSYQISMKDCVHPITGENYKAFDKIGVIAVKEALARETGVPAGMQRLFGHEFSKQTGAELGDELTVRDTKLPGGSQLLMARGPYRFSGTSAKDANWPMTGFTFLGYFAMIDPPRASVPTAVLKCQAAGIKVVMVTGDHPTTAEAIAKQVHIIPLEEKLADGSTKKVLIGRWTTKIGQPPIIPEVPEEDWQAVVVAGWKLQEELDKGMDDENLVVKFWDRVLSMRKYCVFARTSPRQKLLIVQACQFRGGIVAVTGDGVNDSPALKKADIGVAMGITGTEVAKDAADMILLDDNFASIVNGVEEGRIIFDNLKKSIAYTLSSNIPEIAPFLLNQTMGIPLPLTTVMILMVDLGTDLAPAISLAYEGKEADIMQRPPRDPLVDNLVTWRLVSFSYLQIGILQAIAGFFAYFVVLFEYGLHYKYLPGMDDKVVFDRKSHQDVRKYAYFMWCFQVPDGSTTVKQSDYPCVYTPMEWDQDWFSWNRLAGSRYQLFQYQFGKVDGENGPWYADGSTQWYNPAEPNPVQAIEGTFQRLTDEAKILKQKQLFASMICQWMNAAKTEGSGYFETKCEIGDDKVLFESKGTKAGVILALNDRYKQRYCNKRDLTSTGNWVEANTKYSVQHTIKTVNNDPSENALCQDGLTPSSTQNAIFPFQHRDRADALAKSNTAYFISIIIVQWADLMICKTRSRSLFEQGMTNVFMNWSLLFETILGACFCYVGFANDMLSTQALDFVWWLPAVPFSLAIYAYDEIRKGWIRHHRKGWLEYNTYW